MRRISLLTLVLVTIAACGGGGAAIEAPQSSDPATTNPPTTPSNPGSPSSAVVTTAGTSFSPATITVTPGSVVTWRISGGTHNVTFGGAKPTGGDIPDTGAGGQVDRSFGTAGTYDYQCTRHSGMTGRVVVTPDGSGPLPPPSTPSEGIVVEATASAFSPERVDITAGASVTWHFNDGAGGIVFDDEAPSGGNIPPASAGTRVTRTFTSAGDYDYHSSTNRDVKGRIRVR